jgi:hypothetical protein
MPTSTTVSLVFELLGGTFILAMIKVLGDSSLDYGMLLNSDKALQVIIAIFVSVALSFVFGVIVMWLSRLVFTFNYKKHSRYSIAIFGGIAFTALAYFIFMKGMGKSPYLPENIREYIDGNISILLLYTFIGSTILMEVLHLMKINIFKFVVLMGTFALAMAFAGNDLVNFIGVPLAGLDSYNDYMANANGAAPGAFMMTSLMESAKTPAIYLLLAGVVMIIAMTTSKKAQNVIKTSVDLSRQDEGDEMFGSSRAARSIGASIPRHQCLRHQRHAYRLAQMVGYPLQHHRDGTRRRQGRLRRGACRCQPRHSLYAHHHRHQLQAAAVYHIRYLYGGHGYKSCRPCLEPRECRLPRHGCAVGHRWMVHHRGCGLPRLRFGSPAHVLWWHHCSDSLHGLGHLPAHPQQPPV